jgi:acyl transferase domain-containing protein/NADPH:quinone reductase-like Zn-dependent oxidoreductase/NADP-dependent 3-hydroxy acid dehydrogenase YdfG/acyl carrier protein
MGDATSVAIVGAACRLPGAPDLQAFGRLLDEGRDAVTEIPEDRFTKARFQHPRAGETGRAVHLRAGVIEAPLRFDHAGFGISPREAAEMDPQQRLLLTLARDALKDAGLPEAGIAGREFGAYVGASTTDWSDLRQHDPAGADRYMMTGAALSILANRFSNAFDLHGPTLTVDTACSSALVALDAACQAIRDGRIEGALVGGVNMLLSPLPFAGFWKAGMLSRRGRCQAFGSGADGYVRAEGGVVLVLKRLDRALADGDQIRGVIRATGVNAAGKTTGLSLPDQKAQAALIRRVTEAAGLTPDDFGYFEAHGTGTPTGDPIEAAAIAEAVGRRRGKPLPVGSVKSNIGHTEAAAGLVGILKALHVLGTKRVPRTLHTEVLNPNIPFAEHGLRVATQPMPFAGGAVGVNSFGFGGTNACAVVTAAPEPRRAAAKAAPAKTRPGLPPLLLSARSDEALRAEAAAWAELLPDLPSARAAALIRGQARHRDLLPHRLVLRGGTAAALAEQLTRFAAGEAAEAAAIAPLGQGVAFVFSGNGAQWAGMAAREMRESRAFRTAVLEADEALKPLLGRSIAAILKRGPTPEEVAGTDLAQPMLFAVQLGVVAALREQGIVPALCLGHSVGEVAAACVSGLLPLKAAARLIVARSARQHETRGMGRMAALGASAAQAAPVLEACSAPGEPALEIAAINGPGALTIAGPPAALERLHAEADQRRWSFVALDLDYAFHSAFMDPVQEKLLRDLRGLKGREPAVPMISTVTGEELTAEDCTPAYWWRNLRAPVRFDLAMQEAARRKPALFLEIGPHGVLQGYMRACVKEAEIEASITGTLRKGEGSDAPVDPFPALADRATSLGADPRAAALYDGPAEWRALPAIPAGGEAFPLPSSAEKTRAVDPVQDHRLLGFRTGTAPEEWTRTLDVLEEPWLADHKLLSEAVLPATGMLEMAMAAGFLRHPQAPAMEVVEATIFRALPLPADHCRVVRSRLDEEGRFTLESRRRITEEEWTLHMVARVVPLPALTDPGREAALSARATAWDGTQVTEAAAKLGLDYGPAFQAVTALRADVAAKRATAELSRPDAAPADEVFHLHPSRADGALQALLGLLGQDKSAADSAFVPVHFGRVALRRGAAGPVRAELTVDALGQRSVAARLTLRDALGGLIASFEDATLSRLPRAGAEEHGIAFRTEWLPVAPPQGWPEPAPVLDIAGLTLPEHPDDALTEAGLLMEAAIAAFAHEALRDDQPPTPLRDALVDHVAASGLDPEAMPGGRDIWGQALQDAPALAHELAAVAAAAEALPAALSGQAMLPIPSPVRGVVKQRLAARVAEAAEALAKDWPAARPFRVLVAAGAEGRLVAALSAALRPLLGPALRMVVAHLPEDRPPPVPDGVELVAWDPLGSEPPPVEAELVVALGMTPRRPAGEGLAAALRGAAAPGGALLLAEPAPGAFWDLTQGLSRSWWDAPRLASPEEWAEWLGAAGWTGARALPLPALPMGAALVVAGNPPGAQVLPAAPARRFALFAASRQEALSRALVEALAAAGAQAAHHPLEAEGPAPKSLRGTVVVALPATRDDLAAIARLAASAEGAAAGFHIAARGGDLVAEAAGALALGRVLANEMPSLKPRRHDLDAGLPADRAAKLLAASLLAGADSEAEQRLLATGRLVPRLAAGLPAPPPAAGPLKLAIGRPGQLATLRWEAASKPAEPGAGEVLLRVTAAGLNFRDVMWAQGLLPEDSLRPGFAGPNLGMECAGIVEAVGPGVLFRPGDAVFGVAPAAFATRAVTRAEALAPLPTGMSPEDAAGIPVAFLTAVYSLEEVARLQEGERVLIHGGAGAVGLAAMQVALARGARVAATAGNPVRRAFLRQAGAELALDSRDTSFADIIEREWGGVDVVLNSLSGEAMERSLRLMAPFGRFVELGKRDYAENRRVGVRPLRRNVSYFAVDVDEVARAKPQLAGRMLGDISARLADGRLRPLPVAVHEAAEVEAAFRALQAGGHIGKLVLMPPRESAEARAPWLPKSGAVVVTGGAAGFGLEAAAWFAARGVKRLALLSRRGSDTPGAAEAIARLAKLGAEARLIAADVADEDSLRRALDTVRNSMGGVAGVVHAAAVFRDGTAARLDEKQVAEVWRAKVTGAEALDRLTRNDALSLFVMFSSATVPVGSPGQAAYVAANAALEAIARRRQSEGRPALAVQWGPIADAGVLAEAEANAANLSRRLGAVALTAAETLDALPALLDSALPVAGAAKVEWRSARSALPLLAEPAFSALVGESGSEGEEEDLRAAVANLSPEEGLELLRRSIQREVGRILRLPATAIPPEAPLNRLGLDSLGGIELRTGLERRFSVDVPLSAVNDGLTVEALSRRLYDGLRREAAE